MQDKKDAADLKKMIIGMVLIIAASLTMHVFIFSKQERAYRKLPSPTAEETPQAKFVPQGDPVEGKVVALGTERFYLEAATGKRWEFLFGSLDPHPSLDQNIRVFYVQGTPPTAVKVEALP